jgi:hypothetical protein
MTAVQPYFVLGVLLFALGAAFASALWSSMKQRQRSWPDLVAELEPVDFKSVGVVASDYLNPMAGQISMEPEEMWRLVGGYDGLKKMCRNARVMLQLAAYAQRWNFEEGVIVHERMRRDASSLYHAVRCVELGMIRRNLLGRFNFTLPFSVHEAACAYYLMRQRLLALYETSHAGLYPTLAASL